MNVVGMQVTNKVMRGSLKALYMKYKNVSGEKVVTECKIHTGKNEKTASIRNDRSAIVERKTKKGVW
jgi:hypothetical protein